MLEFFFEFFQMKNFDLHAECTGRLHGLCSRLDKWIGFGHTRRQGRRIARTRACMRQTLQRAAAYQSDSGLIIARPVASEFRRFFMPAMIYKA
jgi:hypothetical protein